MGCNRLQFIVFAVIHFPIILFMLSAAKIQDYFHRFSKIAVWAIIIVGIVLRLVALFQNRNLIIDEANIVRNLYERDFISLLRPLRYEQYAPLLFLWIEKLLSMTFGFAEQGLKFYPLFCGIAALFVFRKILKQFVTDDAVWLPLALFAFSPYFIEFSTTIKQYMPDVLIVLLLLLLALKTAIFTTTKGKFILQWSIVGVLSIAASMPAVFALAGVGCYYAWQCVCKRKWRYVFVLIVIAFVWLAAFGVYFWFILKPQIDSSYLQNYHADYFLYALPCTLQEWKHNMVRIHDLFCDAMGFTFVNVVVSISVVIVGVVSLAKKNFAVLILILFPLLCTLIAAMFHQFSLIMRVSLFLLPLLLLLFGFGLAAILSYKHYALRIAIACIAIIMVAGFNDIDILWKKKGVYEITDGFDYLLQKHVRGDNLFVHDASVPTYKYYVEIHPNREKYYTLMGAHLMRWDSDYTKETKGLKEATWFIYTGGFPDMEKEKRTKQIAVNMKQVDYFEQYTCFVYGYVPR